MTRFRPTLLLALLASLLLVAGLTGCSEDDDPTGPTAEAPVLPDPQQLTFDFTFFDQAEGLDQAKADGEYAHFVNAYLRVALLDVMTHLALAPPMTAFAVALHTPPSQQDDGSWIWVYTHVDGDEEAQIRLRGLPTGDGVEWEMRLSCTACDPVLDRALWFHGTTEQDGAVGEWFFHDPEDPDAPAALRLDWIDGELLRFTVLTGADAGDLIEYTAAGDHEQVQWTDAGEQTTAQIRWFADQSGWLQVPDYNGFQRACWDTELRNADCE